ncbi:MAG TPA: hypothetical protein GXZ26_04595 [Firmicutes bacterium]|nr:hypothetical protein [Bacillota bacterium]
MLKSIGGLIFGIPRLLGKVGFTFLAGFIQRRRAVKLFRKQLQQAGLDPAVVAKLTRSYKSFTNPLNWRASIRKKSG